jgi:hypothetical protein
MDISNISRRYAELESRARSLAAEGADDEAILADLAMLPDVDHAYYATMHAMASGERSRLITRQDFFAVIDCPMLTVDQKIEILENTSGYDPPELEAVRAITRDTRALLERILKSVRDALDS